MQIIHISYLPDSALESEIEKIANKFHEYKIVKVVDILKNVRNSVITNIVNNLSSAKSTNKKLIFDTVQKFIDILDPEQNVIILGPIYSALDNGVLFRFSKETKIFHKIYVKEHSRKYMVNYYKSKLPLISDSYFKEIFTGEKPHIIGTLDLFELATECMADHTKINYTILEIPNLESVILNSETIRNEMKFKEQEIEECNKEKNEFDTDSESDSEKSETSTVQKKSSRESDSEDAELEEIKERESKKKSKNRKHETAETPKESSKSKSKDKISKSVEDEEPKESKKKSKNRKPESEDEVEEVNEVEEPKESKKKSKNKKLEEKVEEPKESKKKSKNKKLGIEEDEEIPEESEDEKTIVEKSKRKSKKKSEDYSDTSNSDKKRSKSKSR